MIAKEIPSLRLAAVYDTDTDVAAAVAREFGADACGGAEELLNHPEVEAIVIATPHSRHVVYAEPALEKGLHVLVEKPVAMTVEGARRANKAFNDAIQHNPSLIYAAMFQQRQMPVWRRLREIVRTDLGPIQRCNWVVTDWFRTQAYYDGGGWCATWRYEGGGVLMNQAPHNLDLLLWITGLVPREVQALTRYGRFHRVETEDEVASIIVCDPTTDSHTGPLVTFVTTTGEAPGTNRIEIVGDLGTAVAEDGHIRVRRLHQSASTLSATGGADMRTAPFEEQDETPGGVGSMTYADQTPARRDVFNNFAAAIRTGVSPVAHGTEGLGSVELANAILLAGDRRQPVTLPLDVDDYQAWLAAKAGV